MSEDSKTIETLEEDPRILESKGWNFVAFFQARHEFSCSRAHQKAIETASEQEQQAGIRSFANNGVMYYEVGGREKCVVDSA